MESAANERQFRRDADAAFNAVFARAVFGEVVLADAKACILLACISKRIEFFAVMFGLNQPRERASGIGKAAACLRICIADRDFGANFGTGVRREAQVNAAHISRRAIGFIMDCGAANGERLGFVADSCPATSVDYARANAVHIIVNDDELRIKRA